MTTDNRRNSFFKEMKKFNRHTNRLLRPAEIVGLAVKAGLNKKETLFEVANAYGKLHMRSRDCCDALSQFLSFICKADGVRKVLEYSSMPSFLSVDLINDKGSPEITVVTYNNEFSELLMVLMKDTDVKILNNAKDIPCGTRFDAIIAQPPLGCRNPSEKRADGFGGEAVINLARFLDDKGTIFWITARGVVLNSGAKKTFAHLEEEGFHHHATIDLLPGLFLDTNIGGVALVFRRNQPRKKFVGIFRDIDIVNTMAQSFHQGPTHKSGPAWEWLDGKDLRTYADDSTYHIASKRRETNQDKININLSRLQQYMDNNELSINLGKTKVLEMMLRQKRAKTPGEPQTPGRHWSGRVQGDQGQRDMQDPRSSTTVKHNLGKTPGEGEECAVSITEKTTGCSHTPGEKNSNQV